jgi:hypothetical protein
MGSSEGGVMKWLKERDELIAQTEAFVKSVTARRAEVAAKPVQRTTPIENSSAQISAAEVSARPMSSSPAPASAPKPLSIPTPFPIEDSVSARPIEVVQPIELAEQSAASPGAEPPPIKAFARGEVRQEIQNRVAAFQANQHRFQREREAYYNAVLTKARSTADGLPDAS